MKYLLLTSLLIGVIEFIDGDNTLIGKTKKKISVILSYGRVCRDILSRGKGGYGADCKLETLTDTVSRDFVIHNL